MDLLVIFFYIIRTVVVIIEIDKSGNTQSTQYVQFLCHERSEHLHYIFSVFLINVLIYIVLSKDFNVVKLF